MERLSQRSDNVYFCCWRCVYWACYRCILHLQQYSHRLNLFFYADCLLAGSGWKWFHPDNLYDIYLLLYVHCCTSDDGERNCPKHVKFYSKNKFEKLVHLVGFIIRIYSSCIISIYFAFSQKLSNLLVLFSCLLYFPYLRPKILK